jgi:hypothetical protein
MNNWCICWFFTHIFMGILIFKGLTPWRLYKSFSVKGLSNAWLYYTAVTWSAHNKPEDKLCISDSATYMMHYQTCREWPTTKVNPQAVCTQQCAITDCTITHQDSSHIPYITWLVPSGVPRNSFQGQGGVTPRIFSGRGGTTNSVEDRGQREWGSRGGSPLVRGSTQFVNEWNPYSD